MDAVHAHVHEHEQVPGLSVHQVVNDLEVLGGHLVDLLQQPALVLGAKVLHVEHVRLAAEQRGDAIFQRGGPAPPGAAGRRQEAADADTMKRLHRIGLRHADQDRTSAGAAQHVPHAIHVHRQTGGNAHPLVRSVGAVAEAVEAELPGVLAAEHARPGRHSDGGMAGAQRAVGPLAHQAAQRGQVVPPALEDQRRLRTVQADDEDFPAPAALVASLGWAHAFFVSSARLRAMPSIKTLLTSGRVNSSGKGSPCSSMRRTCVPLRNT